MQIAYDNLLDTEIMHDHTPELDSRYVNVTGDTMSGNLDFAKYKAIQMVCDNGTSFPASPTAGQWFYRSDLSTLFIFQTVWQPIINFADINIYVATTGTDAAGNGYSVSTPVATLAYAWTLVPSTFAGNVTVNMAAGNYVFPTMLTGKTAGGAYKVTVLGATTEVLANTNPTAVGTGSSTTNATLTVSTATWGIGIVKDSGTNTSVTANKLVQTGQNFLTTVKIGMQVKNTTDNTWAHVTAIDSDTTLSLDADIFTATSKAFQIGWGDFKGHYVHYDEATSTTALQGIDFTIYEHNSTVLTLVGRHVVTTSVLTPTTGDTFRIIKPATIFTSGTGSVMMNNLVWKYIEFSPNAILTYEASSVIFYSCWMDRVRNVFNMCSVTLDCIYQYNRLGTYASQRVWGFNVSNVVPQKCLLNCAEYGLPDGFVFVSACSCARVTQRFCNIIENSTTRGIGMNVTQVALPVATAFETGWQFYRNTIAISVGPFAYLNSTSAIFSGNVTDISNTFLPSGDAEIDGDLTITGNAFLETVKSGATQAAAGTAANEIWKTSGHATLPDNVLLIGV